jgi:hypothetical protein
MLKKAITYENIDGVEITEDFYFNLSQGELIEHSLDSQNTLSQKLDAIGKGNDMAAKRKAFTEIMEWSYGERVGDKFVKSPEAWAAFHASEAYSNLLMSFFGEDQSQAAAFINGLMPKAVQSDPRAASEAAMQGYKQPAPPAQNFQSVPDPTYAPPPTGAPQPGPMIGGNEPQAWPPATTA